MSEHTATIEWVRDTDAFEFSQYTRTHRWGFDGGIVIPGSAAPDYMGDPEAVDPEEAFVASLSACHMLTFLAVASKARLPVRSYTDHALGTLGRDEEGLMAMIEVVLRPQIKFDDEVSADRIAELHEKAHKHCFIARSVKCVVRVESV